MQVEEGGREEVGREEMRDGEKKNKGMRDGRKDGGRYRNEEKR